jgi:hypothetical protein
MDEKKDCQYNNITFQNQLLNSYQEEIYIDNDLNIRNDDRINYKDLQYNHEQANNLSCEVNKNKNIYYIPSFDINKEKYEFSVGDPFDFKTKPKSYDDISNEEIYTVQSYLEKKKNRNEKIIGKNKNVHKKFRNDNIMRKIKINYINFIIKFMNLILMVLSKKNGIKFDSQFYNLEHDYKNKISKKSFNSFLKQTIKDIFIKSKISSHYKAKDKNSNIETCNKIEKEIKLKDLSIILNKNILFFFDKIYKKERKKEYNLNELGLFDLKFVLPEDIELYEDLLTKNEKIEENFNEYKTELNICCNTNFMPEKKMPTFITRKSK